MSGDYSEVTCVKCLKHYAAKAETSFLFGFKSYRCPLCGAKTIYPMSSGVRILCWVIVVLFAFGAGIALRGNAIAFPGFITVLAVAMLVYDWFIRGKLESARARAGAEMQRDSGQESKTDS
jgi:hypothetical protein